MGPREKNSTIKEEVLCDQEIFNRKRMKDWWEKAEITQREQSSDNGKWWKKEEKTLKSW